MQSAAETARQSDAADHHQQINPHWEFFYRVAERFGIPAVILFFVLYWARNDLIQPLLDAHFSFIEKVTQSNDDHTSELQNISRKLEELIEVERQTK